MDYFFMSGFFIDFKFQIVISIMCRKGCMLFVSSLNVNFIMGSISFNLRTIFGNLVLCGYINSVSLEVFGTLK